MLPLKVSERNRRDDAEQATAVAGFLERIGQEQTTGDLESVASDASQRTDHCNGEALFIVDIYSILYVMLCYVIYTEDSCRLGCLPEPCSSLLLILSPNSRGRGTCIQAWQ